jgi:hypothetical protein
MRCFEGKVGGLTEQHRIYVMGPNVDGIGGVDMEIFFDGARALRLEFFVDQSDNSLLEGARKLPTIPADTASELSLKWAKETLDHCLTAHPSCGSKDPPFLPTRILSIEDGSGGEFHIRLLQTRDEKAYYACLSHCWGGLKPLVTKSGNIASRMVGISWNAIPKTFQEAVMTTRELGLRYLWIDSLCIIQDDDDDWMKESANMSSIYANSYITIAATKSWNGLGGCFSTASPYLQDYQLSESQLHSGGGRSSVHVRERITHIGDQDAVAPLLSRGWVCQERLLSPRVLHFCDRELVWECKEYSGCQCSCFNPQIRIKEEFAAISSHRLVVERRSSFARSTYDIREENQTSTCNVQDVNAEQSQNAAIHYCWAVNNKATIRKERGVGCRDPLERRADIWAIRRSLKARHEALPSGDMPAPVSRETISGISELSTVSELALHGDLLDRDEPLTAAPAWPSEPEPVQSGQYETPQALTLSANKYQGTITLDSISHNLVVKWRRVITEYSGMNLSKPSDRLPAIAGIARSVGKQLNSAYLAGLWRSALPGDLLWRVDHAYQGQERRSPYGLTIFYGPQERTSAYIAPSWSWASVKGRVKYYRLNTRSPWYAHLTPNAGFSVLETVCQPISPINPFGEVAWGRLSVSTTIEPFRPFFMPSLRRYGIKATDEEGDAVFLPDHDTGWSSGSRLFCIGDFSIDRTSVCVTEYDKGEDLAVSLVVGHVDEGLYERVGILERHRWHAGSKRRPPWVRKLTDSDEARMKRAPWLERNTQKELVLI